MGINRHICKKFHVKGPGPVPFVGWMESNREHIAELFCELGYKVGAEIGVKRGEYSEVLLRNNPGLKMYCVDPWIPYARGKRNQDWCDRNFKKTQDLLAKYNVTYLRKNSMDALVDVPDGSLDFVYVDAMHDFDNVMMDLIGWGKKVKSGGMVAGHDYVNLHDCGVIPAVKAYTTGHTILQWFLTQDPLPSYFWVQP